eukprot:TRINITY_DN51685_c0_g1_i1.p1 TRINITY_DN51685_c0_g1~~TRINITY_DN51685_c0_g1_i1.p1  ORF type:complete len:530 (-),score=140.44 TRINITY_DN51685_c0_g1_i1:4-1593(-)
MDLPQRAAVPYQQRRFTREVEGHILATELRVGDGLHAAEAEAAAQATAGMPQGGSRLSSGRKSLEDDLKSWRQELESRRRVKPFEVGLTAPRLLEGGRAGEAPSEALSSTPVTPDVTALVASSMKLLSEQRRELQPGSRPSSAPRSPCVEVAVESHGHGRVSPERRSVLSPGPTTTRDAASHFASGGTIAAQRELFDTGKGFSLYVGELGYLRDSLGFGSSRRITQVREFSSLDPSILVCRRVDKTPSGFSGGRMFEHQFLALAPGTTMVTDGRRSQPFQVCAGHEMPASPFKGERCDPARVGPPSPSNGLHSPAQGLSWLQAASQTAPSREAFTQEQAGGGAVSSRASAAAVMAPNGAAAQRIHAAFPPQVRTAAPAVAVEEKLLHEEAEEVQRLEDALAQANDYVAGLEELAGMPFAGTLSDSAAASVFASKALSLYGKAGLSSMKDAALQEKARALERDIRSEAATAMELQDRIHWLRGQLRRQAGPNGDDMDAIKEMLVQIRDRLDAADPRQLSPLHGLSSDRTN